MISAAGLKRIEVALEAVPEGSQDIDVRADDVFGAVRTIKELRRTEEKYDELKRALALVGNYLHEGPDL